MHNCEDVFVARFCCSCMEMQDFTDFRFYINLTSVCKEQCNETHFRQCFFCFQLSCYVVCSGQLHCSDLFLLNIVATLRLIFSITVTVMSTVICSVRYTETY